MGEPSGFLREPPAPFEPATSVSPRFVSVTARQSASPERGEMNSPAGEPPGPNPSPNACTCAPRSRSSFPRVVHHQRSRAPCARLDFLRLPRGAPRAHRPGGPPHPPLLLRRSPRTSSFAGHPSCGRPEAAGIRVCYHKNQAFNWWGLPRASLVAAHPARPILFLSAAATTTARNRQAAEQRGRSGGGTARVSGRVPPGGGDDAKSRLPAKPRTPANAVGARDVVGDKGARPALLPRHGPSRGDCPQSAARPACWLRGPGQMSCRCLPRLVAPPLRPGARGASGQPRAAREPSSVATLGSCALPGGGVGGSRKP